MSAPRKGRSGLFQLVSLAAVAALIGLDQWTKWLVETQLQGQPPLVVWEGVFELRYHTNPGAAFGLFPGGRIVFIVLTSVLVVGVIAALLSGKLKRYPLAAVCAVLIAAGGAGNLIDRVVRGEVVDFLYFRLIDFPLFNVADCLVVVGALLLLVFLLFVYNDKAHDKGSGSTQPPPAESAP